MCAPAVAPPPARFRRVIHTGSPKSGVYSLPAALYYESRRHPPRPPESAHQPHSRLPACSSPPLAKECRQKNCRPGRRRKRPYSGRRKHPCPDRMRRKRSSPRGSRTIATRTRRRMMMIPLFSFSFRRGTLSTGFFSTQFQLHTLELCQSLQRELGSMLLLRASLWQSFFC